MGQSVLAYQFVAGLRVNIKSKVAGVEGAFEELLVKARFEEAKFHDLADPSPKPFHPTPKNPATQPDVHHTPQNAGANQLRDRERNSAASGCGKIGTGTCTCFHCGSTSHLVRHCPFQGKGGPKEAPGRSIPPSSCNDRKVANIVPTGEESSQETVADLRRRLQQAEMSEALTKAMATMRVIRPGQVQENVHLGSTPTLQVELEGNPVTALLDTGSPVTIVSLQFLVETLAKQRPVGQSPAEWRSLVEKRLETPTVTLQNYRGSKLNIVRQIKAVIARAGNTADAVIQIQSDAPAELLIGTDLLPRLGFEFLQSELEGRKVDLLAQETHSEGCGNRSSPKSASPDQATQEQESEGDSTRGVVRLIQATRLPAQHMKLLRARIEGVGEQSLFEPVTAALGEKALTMAEAVTVPDTKNCVTHH